MKNFAESIAQIEEKIGYRFSDKRLLEEAFTHKTYAHLHGGTDNERVEFLGDTVLQFVITDYLYRKYPEKSEGELTRLRAEIVCEETLLRVVERLDLEKYLLLEGSASNVGKKTFSSLYETVTGAIYLDSGYERVKSFILESGLIRLVENPREKDAKTRLQEYLQAQKMPPPTYAIEKTGKDNAPTFYCEVCAMGMQARGEGKSKKRAEQQAAERLLKLLENKRKIGKK